MMTATRNRHTFIQLLSRSLEHEVKAEMKRVILKSAEEFIDEQLERVTIDKIESVAQVMEFKELVEAHITIKEEGSEESL